MNRSKSMPRIQYMSHDWPDSMHMTEEAFAEYASKQERDDFENDVRNLDCTLQQLVLARKDTIVKLRKSADYLDSVWFGCKISKGVGTSASVIGGGLTIAGGILTLATAGAAAPLFIAGVATSSVGAATNIGTSVVEKTINSKEVRSMSNAYTIDKDLTLKFESQIDDLRRFKDSVHLGSLLAMADLMLGKAHCIVAILKSAFNYDTTGVLSLSSRFFSEGVRCSIAALSQTENRTGAIETSTRMQNIVRDGVALFQESNSKELIGKNLAVSASAAAGIAVAGAAVMAASTVQECSSTASTTMYKEGTKAACTQLKYNPFGPEILLETGKVVGQNSTKLAGKVIVGVSAAFLVWDAIDLGLTVNDLIRKKGSQAGKILRDKADELEEALADTKGKFSLQAAKD